MMGRSLNVSLEARLPAMLLVLLVAASAAAPALQGFPAGAAPAATLKLVTSRAVVGQDLLLWVRQTGGSFEAGSPIYFELSSSSTWTSTGYYLLTLNAGSTRLPPGTLIYIPRGSTLYPSAQGAWWLLLAGSSSGPEEAKVQLAVEGGYPPVMSLNGVTYLPHDQVDITYYTGTGAPEPHVTLTMSKIPRVAPGDRVSLEGALFRGSQVVVYFLYIYSNKWGDGFQVSPAIIATSKLSGGAFHVEAEIPDAPEGIHAILAVDDKGYYAFMFVYVHPKISPSKISMSEETGGTITVKGRGFPANAKIANVEIANSITGYMINAELVSEVNVDGLGRVSFKVSIPGPIGATGPLDLRVLYDINAPGHDFPEDPDHDTGSDTFKYALLSSTPSRPGDEAFVIVEGVNAGTSQLHVHVGDELDIIAYNFPANRDLELYIGPAKAGILRTDSTGAARARIKVPELPGYDPSGAQIVYPVTILDPTTGLRSRGLPSSLVYTSWTLLVDPSITVEYRGVGEGLRYVTPNSTIRIVGRGLAPNDHVYITESIGSASYNIMEYWWLYNTRIIKGTVDGSSIVATPTGSFEVIYKASYDRLDKTPATGASVIVTVKASETPLPVTSGYYYEIASPLMSFLTNSSMGYATARPGEAVKVQLGPGLVPSGSSPAEIVAYKLYIAGSPVRLYNPATMEEVDFLVVTSASAIETLEFWVPRIPEGPVEVYLQASYSHSPVTSSWLVVSTPHDPTSGAARIEVLPGYKVLPAGNHELLIAGWGFSAEEASYSWPIHLGISGVGEATVYIDNNGAFLVNLAGRIPQGSLRLPAGTYTVYATRTLAGASTVEPDTFEIKPSIELASTAGAVRVGETITLNVYGLEPGGLYEILWSPTPGRPGTALSSPGGTPVVFAASADGYKELVSVVAPAALPYSIYYLQVVPLSDPGNVVVERGVYLLPGKGFHTAGYQDYYAPLEKLTIALEGASQRLGELTGATLKASDIGVLLSTARILVRFTPLNGSGEVIVGADASYERASDTLLISVQVPNFNATGIYGVSVRIFNGTLDTGWVPATGIIVGRGGGVLIDTATILDNLVAIKTGLGTALLRLDEINAKLEDVQGDLAVIETSVGEVRMDIAELAELLGSVNATVTREAGDLKAILNTKLGEVEASIDALAKMISGGFLEINGSLARIEGGLANVTMSLGDLHQLLQAVGERLELRIVNESRGLAELVALKSGEVAANITASIAELRPLIVSVNGSTARIETLLGQATARLDELLKGQATIEDLVRDEAGNVVAEVRAGAARLNASLEAAVKLVLNGLVSARLELLAQLADFYHQLNESNKEILASLADLEDLLAAQNETLSTVLLNVTNSRILLAMMRSQIANLSKFIAAIERASTEAAEGIVNITNSLKAIGEQLGATTSMIEERLDGINASIGEVSGKLDSLSQGIQTTRTQATALAGATAALSAITLALLAVALRRLT